MTFIFGTRRQKTKMAAKYKEYFQLMLKNHKEEFDLFRDIHDRYSLNQHELQKEFNEVGSKIVRIVRNWEDKLCNRSEGSGYGKFSSALSEKFHEEVRREFPMFDSIGLAVFEIKKINL